MCERERERKRERGRRRGRDADDERDEEKKKKTASNETEQNKEPWHQLGTQFKDADDTNRENLSDFLGGASRFRDNDRQSLFSDSVPLSPSLSLLTRFTVPSSPSMV